MIKDIQNIADSSASMEAIPVLRVRAFLRKNSVKFSEKLKTMEAVPVSDTLIAEFDCPQKAYQKTQRFIKRDFDKGIVQDIWFQCVFESKPEQLKLFLNMKIYISGKITGLPVEVARRRFEIAAKQIEEYGLIAVNPMALPHEHDGQWINYMKEDIIGLMGCDVIYMLTGWQASKGSSVEYMLAVSLGIHVVFEIDNKRKNFLPFQFKVK